MDVDIAIDIYVYRCRHGLSCKTLGLGLEGAPLQATYDWQKQPNKPVALTSVVTYFGAQ